MDATTVIKLGGTKVAVPYVSSKDKVKSYCSLTYITRTRIDTNCNVFYSYRTQSNNIMLVRRHDEEQMRN